MFNEIKYFDKTNKIAIRLNQKKIPLRNIFFPIVL